MPWEYHFSDLRCQMTQNHLGTISCSPNEKFKHQDRKQDQREHREQVLLFTTFGENVHQFLFLPLEICVLWNHQGQVH